MSIKRDPSWIYGKIDTGNYFVNINAIYSSITNKETGDVVYFAQDRENDEFVDQILQSCIEYGALDIKTILKNWISHML